ncbi:hypothetical protein SSABA_v1c05120 [Spiroplasma sabaudiense Ar-1343]|uniref:Uncharacterized protein n=1 Tax=Spiroplasma sabaudiense Ar-1343 TaxID=1276257 RepID=W6AJL6_9MOLU|nr:hypothetical protein [Spiroplasma sabaudiense]AHI53919.1 hypothetical protein SSABA_v1c05120 [Spiroplasma sabaudiense Ar-1343]
MDKINLVSKNLSKINFPENSFFVLIKHKNSNDSIIEEKIIFRSYYEALSNISKVFDSTIIDQNINEFLKEDIYIWIKENHLKKGILLFRDFIASTLNEKKF